MSQCIDHDPSPNIVSKGPNCQSQSLDVVLVDNKYRVLFLINDFSETHLQKLDSEAFDIVRTSCVELHGWWWASLSKGRPTTEPDEGSPCATQGHTTSGEKCQGEA